MQNILQLQAIAGGVLILVFTLVWLIQLRTKNAAIADVVWSAAFPLMTLIYFTLAPEKEMRQYLILGTVSIWGMRLAIHLFIRTIGHPEDIRYAALRTEWGKKHNLYMLRFFYFQGILAIILSAPFALIMVNTEKGLNAWEFAGLSLWLVAVVGESIADQQLKNFKVDPANKGKICESGLWNYSRHPNYFFEWLVWVSFFIMALGSPSGIVAAICPVVMLWFLLNVTGIPYTENQMVKSKGEAFIEYQKRTSAFIPLPKRKES